MICLLIFTSCKTQEEVTHVKPGTSSRDYFKNLFHEAISEQMIGNYDRALSLFNQCLTIEPNNDAVCFAIAELYEIQKDYTNAINFCLKAHELDATNKWYSLKLGQLFYKTGDFVKSAKYFGIGITDDEKNIDYKFQYAEVLMNSGQYEKAIEVISDIESELGRYPEFTIAKYEMYMVLNQPEKAENEITLLLADYPNDMQVRKAICHYYMDTKQSSKATVLANEMIVISPESCEGYFILAEIHIRANQLSEAMTFYEKGFAYESSEAEYKMEVLKSIMDVYNYLTKPQDIEMMKLSLSNIFNLLEKSGESSVEFIQMHADFLVSSGKISLAIAQYKKLIEAGINDYAVWYRLVKIEADVLAFEQLNSDSQNAIELFPSQPTFYLYALIASSNLGKYNSAEEFFFLGKDLVVKNNELLSDFYAEMGMNYGRQKDFSNAYSKFAEAISYNSKSALPLAYKSRLLLFEGKINEAKTEIDKGISLSPLNFEVLISKGLILLKEKNYQDAADIFSKAVSIKKNYQSVEYYGDAVMLLGQIDNALKAWNESQQLGNQSELLKRKIANKTYYED